MSELSIWTIDGLGEIGPDDDLSALIADGATLLDGDIVVITSKVVSKAEGRVISGLDREAAIDSESVRVVATVAQTRIVETRHGLVMAAAGVDASNSAPGTVVLLPLDPDDSARRIRAALAETTGAKVAVVITDTAGRAWREGQVDMAIGVAGLVPMLDLRGSADTFGRVLDATITAVADEIASATDLAKGKASGSPIAIVRGLSELTTDEDGPGAASIVRPPAMDLFRLGTAEAKAVGRLGAVASRRSAREFGPAELDPSLIDAAIAAALTAPAPHHTQPFRFVKVSALRGRMLDAMAEQWHRDLLADGFTDDQIALRVARGDFLRSAPFIVVPCLAPEGLHDYPDERRSSAEIRMFDLAAGAAVEAFLVQLTALGLASCWVSSTLFCPEVVVSALELPELWEPLGAVAIGWPSKAPEPREEIDPAPFTVER